MCCVFIAQRETTCHLGVLERKLETEFAFVISWPPNGSSLPLTVAALSLYQEQCATYLTSELFFLGTCGHWSWE